MSTEAKVRKLVREVIPRGRTFRVSWQSVGFGPYRVLRVITPAWKSLPRFERILKVQDAIDRGLAPKERDGILRVSVLTAEEYKRLRPFLAAVSAPPSRLKRRAGNGVPEAARN